MDRPLRRLQNALTPFRSALVREIASAAVFSALCAIASAFLNNVGTLALLLPAALAACKSAAISPSRVLMPMAFASLLGGLMTMIGTPPNVITSKVRESAVSAPFQMFDFSVVGVPRTMGGLLVIVPCLRLGPKRAPAGGEPFLFKIAGHLFWAFFFQAHMLPKSHDKPVTVEDLPISDGAGHSLEIHAIDRGGIVFAAPSAWHTLAGVDMVQQDRFQEKRKSGFAGKQLCCFLIRSTPSESGQNCRFCALS